MKLPGLTLFLLLAGTLASTQAQLAKEFQRDNFMASNGIEIAYQLYVPEQSLGRPYPLAVVLHGSAHSGTDNTKQMAPDTPFSIFTGGRNKNTQVEPTLILVPQAPPGKAWHTPEMREAMFELIDKTIAGYGGHPRRVFLTGFSLGAIGAYDYAAHAPTRFAAINPIAGYYDPSLATKMKGTKIWVWHGLHDPVVNVSKARKMVKALEEAGVDVKYWEGTKHGHHEATAAAQESDELRAWFYSQ